MVQSLVSIIIRTNNRPKLLRRALLSLTRQTKSNFEVVIVDDGCVGSYDIVKEFSGLNVKYIRTRGVEGRAIAANLGMREASGGFMNFLDDDDYFLPSHIQVMSNTLIQHPDVDIVYSRAVERKSLTSKCGLVGIQPTDYITVNEYFDKNMIYFRNFFPIQSVMFRRELFDSYGGMDDTLEYLEDWDLWIKYSQYSTFYYVNEVTSVYHVPEDKNERLHRTRILREYEFTIKEKYKKIREELQITEPKKIKKVYNFIRYHGIAGTIKYIYYKYK